MEDLLATDRHEPDVTEEDRVTMALSARVVIGLCLLADDPELVIPDVLAKDRAKFQETRSQSLVDRAVRRGKRGWMVGQTLGDVSPHVRRPHFAVRWMGPGGQTPRLRPIKGSVVKRQTLTEMPTGYQPD